MHFPDLGLYELLFIAKWTVPPVLVLALLARWLWRLRARQRELLRRVIALEAERVRR